MKTCLLVSNAEKESKKEPLLGRIYEEADDTIMFHLSHDVKVGKLKSIVLASPNTDEFVCCIHNYRKRMYFGLEQLLFVTGQSASKTFVPVHKAADVLESDVIDRMRL